MGDQWLKGFPGGITVLMGNRVAGFLCLKRAWKYQHCSYLCVTSNMSLGYCKISGIFCWFCCCGGGGGFWGFVVVVFVVGVLLCCFGLV